ncbi:MAG TPA: flagellar export protein FliJ [Anaerohalosphaeraceae bacterium]|nr:flagellar export protein FliJ [Anaerohalosphaeraceae bacterium]
MKRFVWRLQRLLDLKVRQHEMLRAELAALSEQAATVRAQILMLKAQIRGRLAEMRTLADNQRLEKQQMFLQFAHVLDTRMKALSDKLASLEQQRREKINQLLVIRKERKSLEKLRARAEEEYRKEQNRQEQRMTDEAGCISYARTLLLSGRNEADSGAVHSHSNDARKTPAERLAVQMSR